MSELRDSNCLTPEEIAAKSEHITEHKATKAPWRTTVLAINAGAFISLAFMFYTTALADGHGKLVGGLCFSLGLIMVVVLGGELFTSSTMTLVSRQAKLVTTWQVLKNWFFVYVGNFIGAIGIVALMLMCRQYYAFDGKWGEIILKTSLHKLHHIKPEDTTFWFGFLEALVMGIFCNIMVCVAVWISWAGKTLSDKILAMILPIGMFVASGFEHSVANMFMIPSGIGVLHLANDSFWATTGLNPEQFSDLTVGNFLAANLIPVTIGNIIGGGVMIGLFNWYGNHILAKKDDH